jgi:hypothetical protein
MLLGFPRSLLSTYSNLKMEAVYPSETSANFFRATWYHIPLGLPGNLHSHRSGNLKCYKITSHVLLPLLLLLFWRENVFKIVPVQVPTKLEMWQNYVIFVFVVTYVLQAMWPCVVHKLITDHRPLLSMRVPRVWALTSSSGGRGKCGLDSRSRRAKN